MHFLGLDHFLLRCSSEGRFLYLQPYEVSIALIYTAWWSSLRWSLPRATSLQCYIRSTHLIHSACLHCLKITTCLVSFAKSYRGATKRLWEGILNWNKKIGFQLGVNTTAEKREMKYFHFVTWWIVFQRVCISPFVFRINDTWHLLKVALKRNEELNERYFTAVAAQHSTTAHSNGTT